MRQVANIVFEPNPVTLAAMARALTGQGLPVVTTSTPVEFLSNLLQNAPGATAILGGGVKGPERQILLNAIRSMPCLSAVLVIRVQQATAIFGGASEESSDRGSMDRVLHAMQGLGG